MTDQPTKPDPAAHAADDADPRAHFEPATGRDGEQLDPANEQDLWRGRASWKTLYPTLVLWALLTIVVCVLLKMSAESWQPMWWGLLVCVVVLIVLVIRGAYRIIARSYRITTQRLFIRRGIMTQTVDQTELLRVDDVSMRQTLLERVLGIGQVSITSSDRSDQKITLTGIAEPALVQEHIRRHTRMVQGKRTLFMEQL
ncbi:MAG: PH domain-containing protein [Phycisphaerae bacterium]|nr:PH domain-containing protein [Phycisphaerae bacterium]